MTIRNKKYDIERLLDSLKNKGKIKILFVCLGNICRSPAAEAVFASVVKEHGDEARFEIDSAGTQSYHAGQQPDKRMRVHAQRRGIELNHVCRKVTDSDFEEFDLIVGMDDSNLANLHHMAPTTESETKIVGMADFLSDIFTRWDSVPDPYYEGAEGFELVLNLLQNGCANLYNLFTSDNTGKS